MSSLNVEHLLRTADTLEFHPNIEAEYIVLQRSS